MPLPVNPFAQSEHYWKVLFTLGGAAAGTAQESFDDVALSVAGFEIDEQTHLWSFELLFDQMPDMEEIKRRLMVLAGLHGVEMPKPQLVPYEQQDWLSLVARDFPPLTIGRFFVHGSHVIPPENGSQITIQIDAGAAFGSGEHGTTGGCLQALDTLAKERSFSHVLDMGCGSGILAIAAAKLWNAPVLAADIDPVAVQVTKDNIAINQMQRQVQAVVSDGYDSAVIKRAGAFDLIIANILARPLVAFAPKLARKLAPGGVAVLSGLLLSQETMVRTAHRLQGLRLKERIVAGEWCTLVLEK